MHPHDTIPHPSQTPPPRLELHKRAVLALILIGLVALGASITGVLLLRKINGEIDAATRTMRANATLTAHLRQEFLLSRMAEKNLIIEDSASRMDEMSERIRVSHDAMEQLIAKMEKDATGEIAERVKTLREGFEDFVRELKVVEELSRADTLAKAAELSRGEGREKFNAAREILIGIIARNRERIAAVAQSGQGDAHALTQLVTVARDALETLHDLQYSEQASLTVFSPQERERYFAELDKGLLAVRENIATIAAGSDSQQDREDSARLSQAVTEWATLSDRVRQLAKADTKSEARWRSTTAVRAAFTRSSQALEDVIEAADRQTADALTSRDRSLRASHGVLLAGALAGVTICTIAMWLVVNLVLREYRAAADVLLHAE
ncbi:MAG: MCP four helix bundle domain-containing protein [Planctomycetota bacterium]|nr:MCP four helix bundle domain-containing protein [Planctomycetota bacterium]